VVDVRGARTAAPRRRRWRAGGSGSRFGIPVDWTTPELARHTRLDAVDLNDPAAFESEAAYLERHGLLTAAERRRLPADAFEPECPALATRQELRS